MESLNQIILRIVNDVLQDRINDRDINIENINLNTESVVKRIEIVYTENEDDTNV
jgi:hypothetical protein